MTVRIMRRATSAAGDKYACLKARYAAARREIGRLRADLAKEARVNNRQAGDLRRAEAVITELKQHVIALQRCLVEQVEMKAVRVGPRIAPMGDQRDACPAGKAPDK